ncbi:MAG: 50S ribosomal protein L28 [Candidatus Omnitrophica bacterium]|nr:50S ribosomal protein L28 [Candidatus Omnitrophota bacterium]
MPRSCDICGKKPVVGRSIARRGLPKKSGGVGLKTTGITRRVFYPNLKRVRTWAGGTSRTLRVCTKCLKAGKVSKVTRRALNPSPPA